MHQDNQINNPMKWLLLLLRFGFGILLIYASVDKIMHPHGFAVMVENYRVFGKDLSLLTAVFVPYLEAVVGILLIIGVWLEASAFINMMLFLVFLILIGQAYIRGLDISCGCFAVDETEKIGGLKLFTNILYAVFSIVLVRLIQKQSTIRE